MGSGEGTPLTDLRVVEVSDRIAGDYCGKLLADAGADVVKVEPVSGSRLRGFTATTAPDTVVNRQRAECGERARHVLPEVAADRDRGAIGIASEPGSA